MTKPILSIVALIIVCSGVAFITINDSKGLGQIVWSLLILTTLIFCFKDTANVLRSLKKVINLGKDPSLLRIDNLKEDGEMIALTLPDCNIMESDTKNSKQRYILYERIYKGVKYEYLSKPTHYSVKYIQLLLSSSQFFRLYIDKTNPQNYYFETPF